jgi:hypothetical protein
MLNKDSLERAERVKALNSKGKLLLITHTLSMKKLRFISEFIISNNVATLKRSSQKYNNHGRNL